MELRTGGGFEAEQPIQTTLTGAWVVIIGDGGDPKARVGGEARPEADMAEEAIVNVIGEEDGYVEVREEEDLRAGIPKRQIPGCPFFYN